MRSMSRRKAEAVAIPQKGRVSGVADSGVGARQSLWSDCAGNAKRQQVFLAASG